MLYVRYGAAISHIQIRETPKGTDYIALPATGEAESSVGSEAVFLPIWACLPFLLSRFFAFFM